MGAKNWIWALVAVLVIAGLFFAAHTASITRADEQGAQEWTWVITHNPVSVFDRAKEVFVEEFNKDSDTKISLKIIGPDQFDTAARRLGTSDVFDLIEKKQAQIGTITLNSLSESVPKASVFSLPYLFRSDAQVDAVFSNGIGKGILDDMTEALPVRAMEFTFSGGWLALQSNNSTFARSADFSGKSIATINGGIAKKVIASTGATVVSIDNVNTSNREVNENLDTYDGVETVLTRLHQMDTPKFVTLTNHALFVTTIVVGKEFYASLSARDQRAFERAAAAAAVTERADSRALAESNKQGLISRGTKIIELSQAERDALASKMQSVYGSFENPDYKATIEAIRALQ